MKVQSSVPLQNTRNFDWILFCLILLIGIFSIINLYSATRVAPKGLFEQQLMWYAIGISLFFIFAFLIRIQLIYKSVVWIYFIVLSLLLVALFFGKFTDSSIKNTNTVRWLKIADFTLQPSEFMKLGIILLCARLFSRNPSELKARPWRYIITWYGIVFIPSLLVLKQPDLGTASICVIIGLCLFFASVISNWHKLLVLFINISSAAILLWVYGLKKYQVLRFKVYLDLEHYIKTEGWQINQALIAIGSGGFWGKGFLKGTQNQLKLLPVHWTDYVFAVLAEEWGFIGSVLALVLLFFLLFWLLHLAIEIRDRFARYFLFGTVSLFFWHILLNLGMATNLLPVVGVNLPFFSYGGSHLITLFVCLGVCMNISMNRFNYSWQGEES